ncbi:MAG: transglutaminase-like domain-containing protein, partial [Lentimicrobium sp.]|nr:transglutaminase-like domain-containing protein [Lentimicrobium sp.]
MKTNTLFALLMLTVLSSCIHTSEKRLITDTEYRNLVQNEFIKQKEIAAGRSQVLFGVLENDLTEAERDGLEFLYAFMPLSDLAMNDGEYYLKQVKSALEARDYFSWGQHVPEDIFLHFVLPYRVNNEYTDTARQVFFRELKDRIKHMSMEDAALEVNHWCHEKVIYKSTDERTSGPLTTVRTAFGRCGEESTFTVAAMRSVGIPARQVYTPRWAHTDDNHAWVEVWIDGQWRFLGACEPEPKLDMGWFAEPVKRAMMTHTFVFGNYQGSEEMVETHARYARLNLLKNYTNVKSLSVSVKNEAGDPVADAKVEFGLYNYAEFYPVATLFTNEKGQCKVSTGYGDLLIHVSKGNTSASQMAAAADTSVEITLLPHPVFFTAGTYSFVPPVKQAIPAVDPAITAENNKRLLQEDSIRNIYISTFMDSVTAAKLAGNLSLNPSELWKYISLSRGNWKEIKLFVESLT